MRALEVLEIVRSKFHAELMAASADEDAPRSSEKRRWKEEERGGKAGNAEKEPPITIYAADIPRAAAHTIDAGRVCAAADYM